MTLKQTWGWDDSIAEPGSPFSKNTTGRRGVDGCGNASGGSSINLTLGGSYASGVFGVALNLQSNSSAPGAGIPGNTNQGIIFQVNEGLGTTNVHFLVQVNTAGQFTFKVGPTVVATSTALVQPAWHYYELKFIIASSGGYAELRVDGVTVLTYTGVTKSGLTGVCDRMFVGAYWPGSTPGVLMDDCYFLDLTGSAPYNTFLGDTVIQPVYETAVGDSSGFINSAGNSTNNYSYVNEVSDNNTNYVGASAAGVQDLYQMGDLPAGYDVLAYQIELVAAKSDGGTAPVLVPIAKGALGATRADAPLPALGTTYIAYNGDMQTTDPDGNALTVARFNAMQVGMKTQ